MTYMEGMGALHPLVELLCSLPRPEFDPCPVESIASTSFHPLDPEESGRSGRSWHICREGFACYRGG
jgi:hypothetical protein